MVLPNGLTVAALLNEEAMDLMPPGTAESGRQSLRKGTWVVDGGLGFLCVFYGFCEVSRVFHGFFFHGFRSVFDFLWVLLFW